MKVTVGLGSLFVGLFLILREFLPVLWPMVTKKGTKFEPKPHLPFALAFCIGALAISVPGGVVRTVASKIVGISNGIGGKIVSGGAGGNNHNVTHTTTSGMTALGALVTVLLLAGLWILRKTLNDDDRKKLRAGIITGITLGLCAGLTGLTDQALVPLVNQIGEAIGGQA